MILGPQFLVYCDCEGCDTEDLYSGTPLAGGWYHSRNIQRAAEQGGWKFDGDRCCCGDDCICHDAEGGGK